MARKTKLAPKAAPLEPLPALPDVAAMDVTGMVDQMAADIAYAESKGVAPHQLANHAAGDAELRRGRPAGSPNAAYATVEEIPGACIKCGAVDLKKVPGSKDIEREKAGTLRNGFRYRAYRLVRKYCECGQRMIVKQHLPQN